MITFGLILIGVGILVMLYGFYRLYFQKKDDKLRHEELYCDPKLYFAKKRKIFKAKLNQLRKDGEL